MSAAAAPAVELDSIAKKFGAVVAVAGVSLTVAEGEFVCFLGPSGCGKTTLLRIIAGLEQQNAGVVRLRGRDVVVLTDPPDPKSGHAISKTPADIVTMSHQHEGHSSLRSVGGEPVVLRSPRSEMSQSLRALAARLSDDQRRAAA